MAVAADAAVAINLTALKDELIDVVSAFLLKEPPLDQASPQADTVQSTGTAPSNSPGTETCETTTGAAPLSPPPPSQPPIPRNEGETVSPVARLRTLVHLISQQDGEFVLKLALYVRHDLHIRNTANFLVALCAREPRCLPFLEGYMEKAIVLPSDWLAVASFAYYFDSDTAHTDGAPPALAGATPHKSEHVIPAALRRALVVRFQGFTEFALAKYNNEGALKRRKYKAKQKYKKDQEAARRARRKAKRRTAEEDSLLGDVVLAGFFDFGGDGVVEETNSNGDDESTDWGEEEEEEEEGEGPGSAEPFTFPRQRTFTYKQLVRLLHIDVPAYLVCCLLGKRYPDTLEQFEKMKLNEPARGRSVSARSFDPARAGTRMRLQVPETWETELAKSGNTGHVWDSLFAKNAVPFMASLRNLRNVLTRDVLPTTHKTLLDRLTSDAEVAASGQMPHRFLSAYYSVQGVLEDYDATAAWIEANRRRTERLTTGRGRGRGRGRGEGSGRGRGACSDAVADIKPLPFLAKHTAHGKIHQFTQPLPPRDAVEALVARYQEAINEAIAISMRLNVQPLPGSALVVLCVWPSMRRKLKAVGGGPVGSLRSKLELAALMAVMVQQCSEDGVVLVSCYKSAKVFRPASTAKQGLLENVAALKALCEGMLDTYDAQKAGTCVTDGSEEAATASHTASDSGSLASASAPDSPDWVERKPLADVPSAAERDGATFPFFYLDEVIGRRLRLESLVVVDEGHHTYGCMNTDAPSLGDLPTYLHRLRHTSSPDLVFVSVSTSSEAAGRARPNDNGADARVSVTTPAQRYTHRNDVLVTGFSDAILRLIAERGHGGPRPYIERADEVYQVQRLAGHHRRLRQRAQQQQNALNAIHKAEQAELQRRRESHVDSHDAQEAGQKPPESLLSADWPRRPARDTLESSEEDGLTLGVSSAHFPSSGTPYDKKGQDVPAAGRAPSDSLRLLSEGSLGALTRRAEAALMKTGQRAAGPAATTTMSTAMATTTTLWGALTTGLSATGDGANGGAEGGEDSSGGGAQDRCGGLTPTVVYHPKPFIAVSKVPTAAGAEGKRRLAHTLQGLVKSHASAERTSGAFSNAFLPRSAPSSPTSAAAMTEREPAYPPGHALVSIPRPLSAFYECRFFISSTFLDMNNERNALTLDVFPRLRRWAADLGLRVSLLEMDLRWGITEAATNEHLSTSVCLNNVSRCAPFFIGMLGDRYGSCPSPLSIVVDDDVPIEDFAWLSTLPDDEGDGNSGGGGPAKNNVSVTELEMRHGVYTSRRRLVPSAPPATVFFSRDRTALGKSLPNDARKRVYEPDTPTSVDRVERLKRFLTSEGVPIIDYTATFTEGARTRGVGVSGEPAAAGGADTDAPGRPTGNTAHNAACAMDNAEVAREMSCTWASRSPSTIPSYLGVFESSTGTASPGGFQTMASGGAQRYLTSQDVLLDMTDFTHKAFFALRAVISQVCGVPLPVRDEEAEDGGVRMADSDERRQSSPSPPPPPSTTASAKPHEDLHTRQHEALRLYMEDLCKVYVPPPKLLEQLAGFALQGAEPRLGADGDDSDDGGGVGGSCGGEVVSSDPAWCLTAPEQDGANAQASLVSGLGLEVVARTRSHILVLTGDDGDGKSSAMAALAKQLQEHASEEQAVVYYAVQADGSNSAQLQSIVLYLAQALVHCAGLEDEITLDESDATSNLVQRFPDIYQAIHRCNGLNVVVLLDAPERCLDAETLLQHMGWIVSPAAAPAVRFVIATETHTAFANAFSSRIPPALHCALPSLAVPERADLVRRHLTLYGKVLQETMDLNELSALLYKRDASHPSYLTAAILYLRLFSTFDTLRQDMRQLPTTIAALFRQLFRSLEQQFEANTCRLVLTTLYLRESAGGVMEHTLYRLTTNVAVASGLMDLLSTTGLTTLHRGLLTLRSSFFATAIANTYCGTAAEAAAAREGLILAELLYQPLRPFADVLQTRHGLRRVVDSIRDSAVDPSSPRLFRPTRYTSAELMCILHDASRAGRADLVLTLVGYLPFLECLLLSDVENVASRGHITASVRSRGGGRGGSACTVRLAQLVGLLLPICEHRTAEVASTAQTLVRFFQQHYQTLLSRPSLLVQCVRNTPATFRAISRYSVTDYLRWGRHDDRVDTGAAPQTGPADDADRNRAGVDKDDDGETLDRLLLRSRARRQSRMADRTGRPSLSGTTVPSEGDVWVQWDNTGQHGAGMRLSYFQPVASQPVLCLAVSPDGKEVALGFPDGYARIAPLSAPEQLKASLKHVSGVTAASFLPSRPNTLVTGCEKGLVYVWSLDDNSLLQVGIAHLRRITAVAAHPQEALVCTGSLDGHALLWDVLGTTSSAHQLLDAVAAQTNGRTRAQPPLKGLPSNRFGALVLGGHKRTQLRPFHVIRHHRGAVSSVAFHRNGEVLATGSWDKTAFLVNLGEVDNTTVTRCTDRGSPRHAFASLRFDFDSPVRVVHFAPSMVVTCAVGTYAGAISLVDFASGVESASLTHLHHAPISALSFSLDGKLLASADVQGQMRISYAGVTGTVLGALNGHHDAVTGLQFTVVKEQSVLISAAADRTVQTWQVCSEQTAADVPTAHAAAVTCVAVSSDASVFITGSADGTAVVFQRTIGGREEAGVNGFTGRRLNTATDEERPARDGGHTADEDACAPPVTYEPLMTLQHDGWRVTSAAFAVANTRFITGVASGDVYVWSSQPGLSRREGRLLLRVPVPVRGIHPVVSLDANDLVSGVSVVPTPASPAAATTTTTSRVTAVCANGDVVHFSVYASGVSLTMQRIRSRQDHSSSSPGSPTETTNRRASTRPHTTDETEEVDKDAMVQGEPTRLPFGHLNGPRHLDDATEQVHAVHRQRLQWAAAAVNGERSGPQTPVPGWAMGEELMAVIPLTFCCRPYPAHTHRAVDESRDESDDAEENANAQDVASFSFNWADTKGENTYLCVETHDAIMVGRQHFFLASYKHNVASALTVRKLPSLVWRDFTFNTHFSLPEEDTFVAVTDPYYVREAHRDVLCAATSAGQLLFFCFSTHAATEDDNHTALNESGAAPMQLWLWFTTTLHDNRLGAVAPKSGSTTAAEAHAQTSSCVLVDALSLSVTTHRATATSAPLERSLDVVVGCRDGSTRVLALDMTRVVDALAEVDDALEVKSVLTPSATASTASPGRSPVTAHRPPALPACSPSTAGPTSVPPPSTPTAVLRAPPPSRATGLSSAVSPSIKAPPASLVTAVSGRRGHLSHSTHGPRVSLAEHVAVDKEACQYDVPEVVAEDSRDVDIVPVERAIYYASAPLKALAILPRGPSAPPSAAASRVSVDAVTRDEVVVMHKDGSDADSPFGLQRSRRTAHLKGAQPLHWIVGDDVGNVYRVHVEDSQGSWARRVASAQAPLPGDLVTQSAPVRRTAMKLGERSSRGSDLVRGDSSPLAIMRQQAQLMRAPYDMPPLNINGDLAHDLALPLCSGDVQMPTMSRSHQSSLRSQQNERQTQRASLYPEFTFPLGSYAASAAQTELGTHTDLGAGGPLWAYLHGDAQLPPPPPLARPMNDPGTAAAHTPWSAAPASSDFQHATDGSGGLYPAPATVTAQTTPPAAEPQELDSNATSTADDAASTTPTAALDTSLAHDALEEKLDALRKVEEAVVRCFLRPPRRAGPTPADGERRPHDEPCGTDGATPHVCAPTARHADTQEREQQRHTSDDEESFFQPLTEQHPPAKYRRSADSVKAWHTHRQEVLKEAMRVEKYNKEARQALKVYRSYTAAALGL